MLRHSNTYAACRHPSDAVSVCACRFRAAFTSTLKRELHLSRIDEAKIDVEHLSQAAQHLHREQIYHHVLAPAESHKHTLEATHGKPQDEDR